LRAEGKPALHKLDVFMRGDVEVQDEGSQLVALALARADVQGSDATWLDMCAGPGGTPASPALAAILPSFPSLLRKQVKGANMPAPRAILAAAVEGAQVDFDTASRIESRYFTELATGHVAKNMIQAFFFDLQAIKAGGSRPEGIGKTPITKIGVLGAGMMGAGIAYVSAKAGFDVVLKDVTIEAANKGKNYSEKLEAKALERGRTTAEKSEALLGRIHPTADPADFKGVDFVIEAVFENQELKHKVFQEIEDIVEPNAILGSNTSTMPITGLAAGVKRQDDFIGIHFFSPVDKMPLVEIIRGEKTSDEALARVFDYTLAIGKTPIVVNDSRGFYTSRVIGTFINEALAMLGEGVEPEIARCVLPQSMYTEFIETGSLAAYARLCGLRLGADAQVEIRGYANGLSSLLAPRFPVSWSALQSS
jgi:3-hydroxyacyl-CoA dehydrogenase/enoyl-CoA hydratase/3-hydroxybutyryl-CoA epimerase